MQQTRVITDKNGKELISRGDLPFPCAVYYSDVSKYVTGDIPWHWHQELELFIVDQGEVCTRLGDKSSFILQAGQGAFINSNILHSMKISGNTGCKLITFVFARRLLSSFPESIFNQKYLDPLINCNSLAKLTLYQETDWQLKIITEILKAYQIYQKKDYGFEILIRNKLSYIFYLIVKNKQLLLNEPLLTKENHNSRIKKMIEFIHSNYQKQLTVDQIAEAANISKRECFRCFKQTINSSPVLYLLKYRLAVASRLLRETSLSITEICLKVGFNTPSYFSKIFKKHMNSSPSSYRQASKI